MPRHRQNLFAFLESAVRPVLAPKGGTFHPKVWLLRYEPAESEDAPVRYRMLCLSRNLTFDRSWDTLLTLDGKVAPGTGEADAADSLGAFVADIAELAAESPVGLDDRRTAALEDMAAEVRGVVFAAPDGFTEAPRFWPLGLTDDSPDPLQGRIDELLVISPFASSERLHALSDRAQAERTLISRDEELRKLDPSILDRFSEVQVLGDIASVELNDPTDESSGTVPDEVATAHELRGLHAKLFVADAGWHARVWTGSANATEAAFSENVEFVVELGGRKSECGIRAMMEAGLANLLNTFQPEAEAPDRDEEGEQLRWLLEREARNLAVAGLVLKVDESREHEGTYRLALHSGDGRLEIDPRLVITTRPLTLNTARRATLSPQASSLPAWDNLDLPQLTSFVAIELTSRERPDDISYDTVLNLPIAGLPDERDAAVLRSILSNRAQVMRYLAFLLADPGDEPSVNFELVARSIGAADDEAPPVTEFDLPLLETLLSALDRDPTRLDRVAALVSDLRSSPATADLLPDDFDDIWDPIWRVRKEQQQ